MRGVAFFVILVGKLLIAIGSGALMYVIAAEYYAEEIVSPLFPAIGSAMLGFGVASVVLGVLDTAAEARDVSSAEKRPSESDGRWCRCPNDVVLSRPQKARRAVRLRLRASARRWSLVE